jgi:hypothetical protein
MTIILAFAYYEQGMALQAALDATIKRGEPW